MIRHVTRVILVALAIWLVVSACGGSSAPTPVARSFTVEADDTFRFTPNQFEAKVGEEAVFTITNKGALEHNFVVFDPAGAELSRLSIPAGQSSSARVTLSAAGEYLIVCDVPGHREAGMQATLTVSP
jgi:uncharacterized cupredoxin-like copper-binding protein